MGAGSEIVTFDEAKSIDQLVGYLAYDHAAKLEPTVPLPAEGQSFPESRIVVCDTLVRFDHGAGRRPCSPVDAEEIAGRLAGGIPWRRERRGTSGPLQRYPERER